MYQIYSTRLSWKALINTDFNLPDYEYILGEKCKQRKTEKEIKIYCKYQLTSRQLTHWL